MEQQTITTAEVFEQFGDKVRVSSPLFKKGALLSDIDPIDITTLETNVDDNGNEYQYALLDRDDIARIYVREKKSLPKEGKLVAHMCIATRGTDEEYGGYEKGDVSFGLYLED